MDMDVDSLERMVMDITMSTYQYTQVSSMEQESLLDHCTQVEVPKMTK